MSVHTRTHTRTHTLYGSEDWNISQKASAFVHKSFWAIAKQQACT